MHEQLPNTFQDTAMRGAAQRKRWDKCGRRGAMRGPRPAQLAPTAPHPPAPSPTGEGERRRVTRAVCPSPVGEGQARASGPG